jgi:TonB family protein
MMGFRSGRRRYRWLLDGWLTVSLLLVAAESHAQAGGVPSSEPSIYAPASTEALEQYLLERRRCTTPSPNPVAATMLPPAALAAEGSPRILNAREVEHALAAATPETLRYPCAQATVFLELSIDVAGRVTDADVRHSSGSEEFNTAAIYVFTNVARFSAPGVGSPARITTHLSLRY